MLASIVVKPHPFFGRFPQPFPTPTYAIRQFAGNLSQFPAEGPTVRSTADILKIGAAVLDRGTILLVRKRGTQVYILPGGKPEGTESDEEALRREIAEELGTAIIVTNHAFLGEFADVSADGSGRRVVVRLYIAELDGTPSPQSEIEEMVWFREGSDSLRLAPSLTNSIIPFLTAAGHVR